MSEIEFDNKNYSELLKEYAPEYEKYVPDRKSIRSDQFVFNSGGNTPEFTNRPMTAFVPEAHITLIGEAAKTIYKTQTKIFKKLPKSVKIKSNKKSKTKGKKK